MFVLLDQILLHLLTPSVIFCEEVLSFSSNQLEGTIPHLVGDEGKNLQHLSFSENNLRGGLPNGVCEWMNLGMLGLCFDL